MIKTLIALSVVFGLVVTDPISRMPPTSNELALAKVDPSSFLLDVITKAIGFKATALTLAVDVIDFLVANAFVIILGAVTTLGFCKLTDKCHLVYKTYEEYVPIDSIRNFVTPEHLENAEQFLVNAVEKYAEERHARKLKSLRF